MPPCLYIVSAAFILTVGIVGIVVCFASGTVMIDIITQADPVSVHLFI